MPLASEIVEKALTHIGVKVEGVTLSDKEISDTIEGLNDMMTEWASVGINLGYQKVTAMADETDLPDWALAAVKFELAAREAPGYGKVLPASLVALGSNAKRAVVKRTSQIPFVNFPNTLPVGAGNSPYRGSFGNYFPDTAANDLRSVQDGVLITGEGEDLDTEIP